MRMCNGIQALLRASRRVNYLHASDSYPVGLCKWPSGWPRKTFEVVVSENIA